MFFDIFLSLIFIYFSLNKAQNFQIFQYFVQKSSFSLKSWVKNFFSKFPEGKFELNFRLKRREAKKEEKFARESSLKQ